MCPALCTSLLTRPADLCVDTTDLHHLRGLLRYRPGKALAVETVANKKKKGGGGDVSVAAELRLSPPYRKIKTFPSVRESQDFSLLKGKLSQDFFLRKWE